MKALERLITTREKAGREIRAVVGDGTGQVAVAALPQHVWIRPYNRDNPVAAFSPVTTYVHNTIVRVRITFIGGRMFYSVLGTDHEAYGHGYTPAQAVSIGQHAQQHQLDTGGADVVYVSPHQFTPLLMYPTLPPSMRVYINAGYWRYGGLLHHWPGGTSADLTSQLPPTDYAYYLLIYFDAVTSELKYMASESFASTIEIPSAFTYPIAAPPLSVVVGYVLLKYDTAQIETVDCFPYRSILNVEFAEATAQTWMLGARDDALFQSTGGYTWSQIGSGDGYLTAGLRHVAVVASNKWLIFRGQATADTADPLVYGTEDSGESWEKKQTGFDHTQGTALWAVTAITCDPDDSNKIAVVIHPTNESAQPKAFITLDGGDEWSPVDMTDMPAFAAATDYWPMSIAVQDWTLPHICIALGTGGLYRKLSTGDWVLQDLGTDADAWAVLADLRGATNWVATTNVRVLFTANSWSTYTECSLYNDDWPSNNCHYIYQHRTNLYQFAVGASGGPQVTFNGGTFQRVDAMEFGKVGLVLRSVKGQPGTVYFTRDSDGALFASSDGAAYNAFALSLDDVVAFDGFYGDLASSGGGAAAAVSWLEHWTWG